MNARSGNGRTDLNAYRRLPLIRRFVREERERDREREQSVRERERKRDDGIMLFRPVCIKISTRPLGHLLAESARVGPSKPSPLGKHFYFFFLH